MFVLVLGFVLGAFVTGAVCAIVWPRGEPEAFPAYQLRRSVWDIERQAVRELLLAESAAQRTQDAEQQDASPKPDDEEQQP